MRTLTIRWAPAFLAAAAARTKQMWLTSAVTVLSSGDPVLAFRQFAALNLISQGRAEIIVGRGSFIEYYPLFGFDLERCSQTHVTPDRIQTPTPVS
jgi:alkanesulfonate monooxygenase SsuD/methylene tetrahydromethanopterin reductase-like flavin-dependent oxidoreductase (luciferase family)